MEELKEYNNNGMAAWSDDYGNFIVENRITESILENQCVSTKVKDITSHLFSKIKSHLQGQFMFLKDVKCSTTAFTVKDDLYDTGITVKCALCLFLNDSWRRCYSSAEVKTITRHDSDTNTIVLSRNIVGTELPHDMFVDLQHEVAHYFNQASNNGEDVLSYKYRNLYNQTTKHLGTKLYAPEDGDLIFALYWSFNNEITANVHELEAELAPHKGEINNKTWGTYFKNTTMYDILKTTEKVLFLCKTKQVDETKIKKLFGITMDKYIGLLEAGYKKMQDKCGKVVSTFLGESKLTVDHDIESSTQPVDVVEVPPVPEFTLNNANIIRNISTDQKEILYNIMKLYNDGKPFDCDITASTLNFYKKKKSDKYEIPEPKYLFDVFPQCDKVVKIEPFKSIPLPDNSIHSIVVDLPFLICPKVCKSMKDGNVGSNLIASRFSSFYPMEELIETIYWWLQECYRVLLDDGIVVWKMQSTVSGGRQVWASYFSFIAADYIGFYTIDEFILQAKTRMVSSTKIKKQKHSRKYTSNFFVFKKNKKLHDKNSVLNLLQSCINQNLSGKIWPLK